MNKEFDIRDGHILDRSMEYTKEIDDLVYLLSCAVNETKPDIAHIQTMKMEAIYRLASYHLVASLISFVLETVTDPPSEFEQTKKKALRKLALFDYERNRIYSLLNEEKIWHVSLKGIILKDYYPRFGMREMTDNDILCDADRMEEVRHIMEGLGFQCTEYDKKADDIYTKTPLVFEMHRSLFNLRDSEHLYSYYLEIKDKLLPDSKCDYEYRFTPEDFYIYMIAHEYKHYQFSGTGLRSLLDIYVFLKRNIDELDWQYISGELEKLHISKFEQKTRELSLRAFSGDPLSKEDQEELIYYVSSGTFGTTEHSVTNLIADRMSGDDSAKSKQKYLKNRLFVPMVLIKVQYPFYYKHKYLIPVLYFYRLLRAVFVKPKEVLREVKRVKEFEYSKKDQND